MEPEFSVSNYVDWRKVAGAFPLSKDFIHLGASQFLSSHAVYVQNAIDKYAQALNADPVNYTLEHNETQMQESRKMINEYFGTLRVPGNASAL
jgi:hypothetical protein